MIQDVGWVGGQLAWVDRIRWIFGIGLRGSWCAEGGALVAAAAERRQCGGAADGRTSAAGAGGGAGLVAGADRRGAGPDAAGDPFGAGGSGRGGELRRGVAVLPARRDDLQKKACSPSSRTGRT